MPGGGFPDDQEKLAVPWRAWAVVPGNRAATEFGRCMNLYLRKRNRLSVNKTSRVIRICPVTVEEYQSKSSFNRRRNCGTFYNEPKSSPAETTPPEPEPRALSAVCIRAACPARHSRAARTERKIITASTIIKMENLGTSINTEYAELRPTISADGNLLFLLWKIILTIPSSANPELAGYWYSFRNEDGSWGKAEHMGYPLNTYHYNAVFWISPDYNRILVRNAYINGDYIGNGVSMSYLRKNGTWSKPEMLKIGTMPNMTGDASTDHHGP